MKTKAIGLLIVCLVTFAAGTPRVAADVTQTTGNGSWCSPAQDAPERGINAQPIDEALTKLGKDGRATEAEVVVSAGLVRITDHAWYKTVTLRGITRNAMTAQISAFRIADPAAQKRADDLLDCFTYGCIIGIHVTTVRNWVMAKARAEAKTRRLEEALT